MKTRTAFPLQSLPASGRAFTMVELLVVVAVIGTLAALTLPAVQRMIKRGSQADCVSNLRQWGTAIHTYIGENNGALPLAWINVSGGRISWNHFDAPVPRLFRENMESNALTKWRRGDLINGCSARSGDLYGSAGYTYRYYSYLLNWHLSDPALGTNYRSKLASLERPSRTILLVDGADKLPQTGFFNNNYETVIGYVHEAKANALFVDGHIESMSKINMENVLP